MTSQQVTGRDFNRFPCKRSTCMSPVFTKALVPGASVGWPFLSTDSGAHCLDLRRNLSHLHVQPSIEAEHPFQFTPSPRNGALRRYHGFQL